jgi:secondary thiamine-phosphate synthase enzyme
MTVETIEISIPSKGRSDIVDITQEIVKALNDSKMTEGIINIFVCGSTGSISTIEHEPGLLKDVPRALDKIAPFGPDYKHHDTWHDDNGASHVRATLMGPGITVPFKDKQLLLGTWQQICLIDHDTKERNRKIILTVIGNEFLSD